MYLLFVICLIICIFMCDLFCDFLSRYCTARDVQCFWKGTKLRVFFSIFFWCVWGNRQFGRALWFYFTGGSFKCFTMNVIIGGVGRGGGCELAFTLLNMQSRLLNFYLSVVASRLIAFIGGHHINKGGGREVLLVSCFYVNRFWSTDTLRNIVFL